MKRLSRARTLWLVATAMWLTSVFCGLGYMWSYAARQGASGKQPARWPALAALARDPSRASLVVILHPQCPCSRATIEELNRLVARCDGKFAVEVLFVRPAGMPPGWERTDLWNSVAAVPGVNVRVDVDGAEARRFGAMTSGQALLYDATGRLVFRGGLTSSRGHAGDNAGCDAIADLIKGREVKISQTPVFGCSLFAHSSADVRDNDNK